MKLGAMNVVARSGLGARGGSRGPYLRQAWPAWLVLAGSACAVDPRTVGVEEGPDRAGEGAAGEGGPDESAASGGARGPMLAAAGNAVDPLDEACTPSGVEVCDPQLRDEDCNGQRNEAPPCQTLTAVATSQSHACGITSDGRVLCWGQNSLGQLGDGTTEDSPAPVEVLGVSGATSLAVGATLSCAVLGDRSSRCWGRQTLRPFSEDDPSVGAARVTVFPEVQALAVGGVDLCALLPDQTVSCSGLANVGPPTVAIEGLTAVQAIARAYTGYCAIVANGAVRCWGGNFPEGPAVPVEGVVGAVELGGGSQMCARLASGQVSCWGATVIDPEVSQEMRLGAAAIIPDVEDAVSLSTSFGEACVLRPDGSVACWGEVFRRYTPVVLSNLQGVAGFTLMQSRGAIVRLQSGEVSEVSPVDGLILLTQLFIP